MPVEIRIFEAPEAERPAFRTAGRAMAATAVTVVERLYTLGYFSIEIPREARHAMELKPGRLVLVDGTFWGIVDDLSLSAGTEGEALAVSGRQLKGIMQDRITIPAGFSGVAGTQGYDAVTGPTETLMQHFVRSNLGEAAQPQRRLFGLEIAPDRGRGILEDRYMSRHQVLSEVLAALGEAAGLGWDLTPDLERHKFVFDVVQGADHTALQSARKRVIFEIPRKTVLAQQYQKNASDSRNLFYATMAGAEFADEALTVSYTREGEAEPAGIRRREQHLEVSADTPAAGTEYQELKRLVLLQAEAFRSAEAFSCALAPGPYRYGADFALGDRVTIRNRAWGVSMDAPLTEMQTTWSSSGLTRTATFGRAPINVFGRLRRMIGRG